MRGQLFLAATLAFMTGWIVGVTKLSQILMTTPEGPFPTSSEAVAEQFLITFGVSKAVGNLIAGSGADVVGRKPVMLAGWAIGAAFAAAVLSARSWTAVVASDLLLGLNQALCWSAALFLAHDLFGPNRRALASGLVETSGYAAIALASPLVDAMGTSGVRAMHGALLALSVAGFGLTLLAVRETRPSPPTGATAERAKATIVWPSGRRDTVRPTQLACVHASCLDGGLMACCLVGLALNLATAFAWGLMTRWLGSVTAGAQPDGTDGGGGGMDGGGGGTDGGGGGTGGGGTGGSGGSSGGGGTGGDGTGGLHVGTILLLYSIPKGLCQLPAGYLADARALWGAGPREFVCAGLGVLGAVLALFALLVASSAALAPATTLGLAAPLAVALGAGTAMAYSPVLACVAARAEPEWRASALGAYRFWRDMGYALGGLLLGSITDVASGAAWVAPLLAAGAVLATAAIFACSAESTRAVVVPLSAHAAGAAQAEMSGAPGAVASAEAKSVATATTSYGRLQERGVV